MFSDQIIATKRPKERKPLADFWFNLDNFLNGWIDEKMLSATEDSGLKYRTETFSVRNTVTTV